MCCMSCNLFYPLFDSPIVSWLTSRFQMSKSVLFVFFLGLSFNCLLLVLRSAKIVYELIKIKVEITNGISMLLSMYYKSI